LAEMMAIRFLVFVAACTATWANAFCFAEAAQRYGVDERLLMAIAKQESDFQPQAKHTNENGSVDVGLMQINSQHFKTLSRFNITEQSLLDPCVNVLVGAWILAGAIKEHGPTWRAVGAYNAGSKPAREADRLNYAAKVFKHLEHLTKKSPSFASETRAAYSMQVIE
jgi:soluble lytic murein transglycosylase-like protein